MFQKNFYARFHRTSRACRRSMEEKPNEKKITTKKAEAFTATMQAKWEIAPSCGSNLISIFNAPKSSGGYSD